MNEIPPSFLFLQSRDACITGVQKLHQRYQCRYSSPGLSETTRSYAIFWVREKEVNEVWKIFPGCYSDRPTYRTWYCLYSSSCRKTRTCSSVRVVSNLCWTSANVWRMRNPLSMSWKWLSRWWNLVFHPKQRNSSTPSLHVWQIYVRHSPVRENFHDEYVLHLLHRSAFHVDECQFVHELFLRLIQEKVSHTNWSSPIDSRHARLPLESTWMSTSVCETLLGRVQSLVCLQHALSSLGRDWLSGPWANEQRLRRTVLSTMSSSRFEYSLDHALDYHSGAKREERIARRASKRSDFRWPS